MSMKERWDYFHSLMIRLMDNQKTVEEIKTLWSNYPAEEPFLEQLIGDLESAYAEELHDSRLKWKDGVLYFDGNSIVIEGAGIYTLVDEKYNSSTGEDLPKRWLHEVGDLQLHLEAGRTLLFLYKSLPNDPHRSWEYRLYEETEF